MCKRATSFSRRHKLHVEAEWMMKIYIDDVVRSERERERERERRQKAT